MKITADMVGKRVRAKCYGISGAEFEVLCVGKEGVFMRRLEDGDEVVFKIDDKDWELAPEPPKKPSARIAELAGGVPYSASAEGCALIRTRAITVYLDELREQGKI